MKQQRDNYDFQSSSNNKLGLYLFGKDGKFFFHYNDINGEPIIFSEIYETEQNRKKGLQSFLNNFILPSQVIFNTMDDGRCYFSVRAKNHQEVAQSRIFKNEQIMKEELAKIVARLRPSIAEENIEDYTPSTSYMEQEEKIVDLSLQLENKKKKISFLNEVIADLKVKIGGYATNQTSLEENNLIIENLEKELVKEKTNYDNILEQARKKYAQLEITFFAEKKAREKDIEQLSIYRLQIEQLNQQVNSLEIAKKKLEDALQTEQFKLCLLYTSPSPRDATLSRMPSSA